MNKNIYVAGDVHGTFEIEKLSKKNWPEQKNFDGSEVLIQVGDFGLIWDPKETNEEKYWLDWLSDKNFTTVFIDGNHENFNRLFQFPKDNKFGNEVRVIRDNIFYLQRGNIYEIYGKKFLAFGGASSHDRQWRTNQLSWWPEEQANIYEMDNCRKSLANVNYEVDYVLTHTIPTKMLQTIFVAENYKADYTSTFLQTLIDEYNIKFKDWFCGHFHVDVDYYEFHVLYNKIKKII